MFNLLRGIQSRMEKKFVLLLGYSESKAERGPTCFDEMKTAV